MMIVVDLRSRLLREERMRTLEQTMSSYAAYHLDPRNTATHFVGVPMIMFSLFIAFGWLRFEVAGLTLSGAMLLAAAVLAYYFLLDAWMALAMTAVCALMVWAAQPLADLPAAQSGAWFGFFFIVGWIIQLIGHLFEGRKPALADNLLQIFAAPLFLCAEAFFALGYRPALRAAVNARALELRAAAQTAREIPVSQS
jgi:uncharacterized membrane protein YGL010W